MYIIIILEFLFTSFQRDSLRIDTLQRYGLVEWVENKRYNHHLDFH